MKSLPYQKSFKVLYEQTMKASIKFSNLKGDFDKRVGEIFGGHYSDVDDDWIIDSMDYGLSNLPYDEFMDRMIKHKEKRGWKSRKEKDKEEEEEWDE